MVWVKFHDKLCRGAKRGLPRAARFVFMELCLEARPGRGVIALPLGMSALDALHDVLGGNRKEIADAIKALTTVPKPSPDDPEPRAMVEIGGEDGALTLTIPSWEAWNSGHEAPGASTERSRRHRQRSAGNDPNTVQRTGETDGDGEATPMQRSLHPLQTLPQRSGNGGATQYRGEERREEKISHTQRAPADARETMPEPPPSSQPGACAFDDFAAMLSEVPALAVLSGDRMALSGLHQGFVMAHKGRATLTLATQAAAALVAQGVPEDRLAARKLLGRFLANQRPEGERESPAVSPDARVALDVFGEVWAAKKRRAFVAGVGDEKHATALVEAARQHAERLGVRPREVVRFWAERYLADDEKFVADPEHPLRLLPSRLTSYGAPKAERPAKAPQAPKEAPVLVAAPPPANLASGLVDAAKAARDGAMPKRPGASS